MRPSSTRLSFRVVLPLLAIALAPLAAAADDAKAIIEKAVKAHGYKEPVAGEGLSYKSKGTVFVGGQEIAFTAKTIYALPDKMRQDVTVEANDMKISSGHNSKGSWMMFNDMPMEATEPMQAAGKHQMHAEQCTRLLPLLKESFTLEALPAGEVEGKKVVGVLVKAKDKPDVKLWFDADSGLLAKSELKTVDGNSGSEISQESFYKDHKDFDGEKRFTKIVIKRDGEKFLDMEASDWKKEAKPDEKQFEKPEKS